MPLLEVTQTRYVSASIRLTDTTASQLDRSRSGKYMVDGLS